MKFLSERQRKRAYNATIKKDFLKAARLSPKTPIRMRFSASETIYIYVHDVRFTCQIGSDDDGFAFFLDGRKRVGYHVYSTKPDIVFDFSPEYLALLEADDKWHEEKAHAEASTG